VNFPKRDGFLDQAFPFGFGRSTRTRPYLLGGHPWPPIIYGGPTKWRLSLSAPTCSRGGGPSAAQIETAMMKAVKNGAATCLKFIDPNVSLTSPAPSHVLRAAM
jgi:hypothetical protein